MILEVHSETDMNALGKKLGALLRGGEIIELIGDVGAGKTTLTKGIAAGLAIDEDIQSPSFTISRVYSGRDDLTLSHYDFYRLQDAGIMAEELHETIRDPQTVTVIEWANIVTGILPDDRLTVHLEPLSETSRHIEIGASGDTSERLREALV